MLHRLPHPRDLDLFAPELGGAAPPVAFESRVYDASAAALLAVVRETPEERRTLLLVGHRPGVVGPARPRQRRASTRSVPGARE
jgi:hypothetical protein